MDCTGALGTIERVQKLKGMVTVKLKIMSRVRRLNDFFLRINCECRENLERLRPSVRLRD